MSTAAIDAARQVLGKRAADAEADGAPAQKKARKELTPEERAKRNADRAEKLGLLVDSVSTNVQKVTSGNHEFNHRVDDVLLTISGFDALWSKFVVAKKQQAGIKKLQDYDKALREAVAALAKLNTCATSLHDSMYEKAYGCTRAGGEDESADDGSVSSGM